MCNSLVRHRARQVLGFTLGCGNFNMKPQARKERQMRLSAKFLPAILIFALVAAAFAASGRPGPKFETVHGFTGADGAVPQDSVIRDRSGNLYGATEQGG